MKKNKLFSWYIESFLFIVAIICFVIVLIFSFSASGLTQDEVLNKMAKNLKKQDILQKKYFCLKKIEKDQKEFKKCLKECSNVSKNKNIKKCRCYKPEKIYKNDYVRCLTKYYIMRFYFDKNNNKFFKEGV